MLKTVRVRHPVHPDVCMTINEAELRDDHDLWPGEQRPQDRLTLVDSPAFASRDDAELYEAYVDAAEHMMAVRYGMTIDDYRTLPATDRLAHLNQAAGSLEPPADPSLSEADTGDLRVGKGPAGRWYVLRENERISSGYATEAEAMNERDRLLAEAS